MAFDLFSAVKGSLFHYDEVTIDSMVFRLHYRVTVALLLGSSLVGVAKQYFGDPINCQAPSGVSSKVLDDYCWVQATSHLRPQYQGTVGCIVDHGLLPEAASPEFYSASTSEESLKPAAPDTAFYQWVPFVLILQASMFYLPRRLWKACEGGLMASFGQEGRRRILLRGQADSEWQEKGPRAEDVVSKYSAYFQHILHQNTVYFTQFYLCELLNLVVVVSNIYLTNYFLSGRFLRYGVRVFSYLSQSQTARAGLPNPLCTVFPTVTSCTFHSVGTAAGEQRFNSICVLSLNIINEKVYLVLWVWLFLLTILTASQICLQICLIALPPLRLLLLVLRSQSFGNHQVSTLRRLLSNCFLGDWFVLYQLSKNCDCQLFRQLVRRLDYTLNFQHKSRYGKDLFPSRPNRSLSDLRLSSPTVWTDNKCEQVSLSVRSSCNGGVVEAQGK